MSGLAIDALCHANWSAGTLIVHLVRGSRFSESLIELHKIGSVKYFKFCGKRNKGMFGRKSNAAFMLFVCKTR